MSNVVLDSSVLLALLNHEPGTDKLPPELLSNATSSTVNLAEVQTKLVRDGISPDEAWEDALSPIREAMPFTEEHAKIAGSLVAQTRSLGLSMGDRACLALGIALNAPIYTADRSWKGLKLGVRIHVIR
ncbi:MAG TPA: type II toxin-antitoxin system VapC family toxin [Terriglobales bacterium]|jgi:ribonuclease VapC|nr:type II toxin-antitoxin system VapC family toxin [Terriglobales bacterium]